MTVTEALLAGILQGAAEFLPISSSGHLSLLHAFFGGNAEDLTFDILLHLSTLFAVLIVYFKDISSLFPSFLSLCVKLLKGRFHLSEYSAEERTVICLFFGTIPLAAAFFIKDTVEIFSDYPRVIGALLLINSIMLLLGERFKGKGNISDMTRRDAFAVGIFQLLAVFPGISRSGSTITGGSFMGLLHSEAVRFSFLLSVPAVIGANITNISAVSKVSAENALPYLVGMAAAFLSGMAAIKLLLFISERSNFRVFSYYCAFIGALAIAFG